MRTELPSGWESAELGCLAQLINGDRGDSYPTKSSFVSDGVPFINAGHLNDGEITSTEMNYITLSAFQALRSGQVREDDILFCLRGSLGKVGLVKGIEKGAIASSLVIVRPTAQAHSRFLLYFLRSPLANKEIEKHNNGSAQPNLASKSLAKFVVPVAPIEEQKRIAEKLDTVLTRVDAVNTRLARVAPLLKRFRQSVLAAATSGRLTEDWRLDRRLPAPKAHELGTIIRVSSGQGLTAKQMVGSGGIPVFGGNGITGYHDQANTVEPTLLIGRVGYYCGSVHLTPPIAWVTDNALIVRHDPKIVQKNYLFFALQAIDLRQNDSSTAQPVISGQKIYGLLVVLPHFDEQTEIVRRVETLFAFADRLEARLAQAQTAATRLTPALLAKAFRGELVPQDPNDEPAAELLRRLASSPTAPAKRGRAAKAT